MPFEWGVNDCLAFVAKGVSQLTGIDMYGPYSAYYDEATANQMLKENGGAEGIISKSLGHSGSRDIMHAGRGDVVIAKLPLVTAGLVDDTGQHIAFVTEQGLRRVPLKYAWRVWSY